MLLVKQYRIYRKDIQANPRVLYIFGDNLDRDGFGGQAFEMRGEPNSFGFATKRSISHGDHNDYFHDDQEDTLPILAGEFKRLKTTLVTHRFINGGHGGVWDKTYNYDAVVFPLEGIGTGLSRMPEFAPLALEQINDWIESLKTL